MNLSAPMVATLVAVFYAMADILVRGALRHASPIATAHALVGVQWFLYSALLWAAGPLPDVDLGGVFLFIAAGLLTPVLFATFFFVGIRRIGVARASTLKATAPLSALLTAVLFLGERPNLPQYVGIALILCGVLNLLGERGGLSRRAGLARIATGSPPEEIPRKTDILIPVLAGVSTGTAAVVTKFALARIPSPLLGVWIGATTALLAYPFATLFFPKGERYSLAPAAWPWLLAAGGLTAVAVYGRFLALSLGQVSIVIALVQTSPLFVIFLAVLFLRQLEQITARVILGAVLTVAGGVLVNLF